MTDTDAVTGDVTLGRALGHLALSLAGWAVSVGVAVAVVRLATSPDAGRTTVMRLTRAGEQHAMRQAQIWASIADSCATAYDKARPVTAYGKL